MPSNDPNPRSESPNDPPGDASSTPTGSQAFYRPAAPAQVANTPPQSRPRHIPTEKPGDHIGPYKLLELLGEGGFGSVWAAEQTHPLKRRVALKLLHPGMDSRTILARFEQERQALAMMDHPNIARVLDAGVVGAGGFGSEVARLSEPSPGPGHSPVARLSEPSPDSTPHPKDSARRAEPPGRADLPVGRPYFVMELVRGVPITQYCDAAKLTPRKRMELMQQVCRAVQHAHTKGIIHRDIKPGNVLVTLHGDQPVPKVIDFGIAKATTQPLTDKTIYTEFRQLIGTPPYMSPEQAEMSGLDIDTRTDIYALGALMYELLTGSPPLDPEALRRAGIAEVYRLIKETEPPKPSTKVSTIGGRLREVAGGRGTEPGKLSALLRGEPDWIVMKAMEKDRTRRYETADSLAADIGRYLTGEAVLAGPPSAAYRVRRFVRRHRVGVGAGAAVVAGMLFALAGLVWGIGKERDAKIAIERNNAELNKANQYILDVTNQIAAKLHDGDWPETEGKPWPMRLLENGTIGFVSPSGNPGTYIVGEESMAAFDRAKKAFMAANPGATEREWSAKILDEVRFPKGIDSVALIDRLKQHAFLAIDGQHNAFSALQSKTAELEAATVLLQEEVKRAQLAEATVTFRIIWDGEGYMTTQDIDNRQALKPVVETRERLLGLHHSDTIEALWIYARSLDDDSPPDNIEAKRIRHEVVRRQRESGWQSEMPGLEEYVEQADFEREDCDELEFWITAALERLPSDVKRAPWNGLILLRMLNSRVWYFDPCFVLTAGDEWELAPSPDAVVAALRRLWPPDCAAIHANAVALISRNRLGTDRQDLALSWSKQYADTARVTIQREPSNTSALGTVAIYEYLLGCSELALDLAERSESSRWHLATLPNPVIRCVRAMSLFKLGRTEEARMILSQVQENMQHP